MKKSFDRKICREKKLSFSTTGINEREYFLNFQLHIFLGIPSGKHSTIIFFTDTLFRGIPGSTTQIKFSSKESQSLFKMSQSNLAYTPRQPFLHPQPPRPPTPTPPPQGKTLYIAWLFFKSSLPYCYEYETKKKVFFSLYLGASSKNHLIRHLCCYKVWILFQ